MLFLTLCWPYSHLRSFHNWSRDVYCQNCESDEAVVLMVQWHYGRRETLRPVYARFYRLDCACNALAGMVVIHRTVSTKTNAFSRHRHICSSVKMLLCYEPPSLCFSKCDIVVIAAIGYYLLTVLFYGLRTILK